MTKCSLLYAYFRRKYFTHNKTQARNQRAAGDWAEIPSHLLNAGFLLG
jgi:hypothetical protein